jgi:SAM-dependent methyltransferase
VPRTEPSASTPATFVLDEGNEPGFAPSLDIGPRWKELPHAPSRSRGFILLPGERILSDAFRVDPTHRVRLEAMRVIEHISLDGLDLYVELEIDSEVFSVASVHLGNEQHLSGACFVELSLESYAGRDARLSVRCSPGSRSDPSGDWAALLAFVMAPGDKLNEATARGQRAWRFGNELCHFNTVREQEFYKAFYKSPARREAAQEGPPAHVGTIAEGPGPRGVGAAEFLPALAPLHPEAGDNAFVFTHRLLGTLIARPQIDFASRLRALGAHGRRPRLLSLCAGEAGIEGQLIESAGTEVDITLLDVNGILLERAAARMPPTARTTLWQGAVESLRAGAADFDVVCFVSGLHHVVVLEEVLSRAVSWLAPGGEFWLIGEQVGRNGNRLWPDAQRVADRLFRDLPERLRFNHSTGRLDESMPDVNYASSCFEGIRSEDIPVALARYFTPETEHRRDCFLWRFVEVAYSGNYDLASEEDVQILRTLVAEEFAFYCSGGLGTELNGVYRAKAARGGATAPRT